MWTEYVGEDFTEKACILDKENCVEVRIVGMDFVKGWMFIAEEV